MTDIIILTKADRGISKETLISLAKYTLDNRVVLHTDKDINWFSGERLTEYRLKAVKKSTTDWVFLLDSDDEVLQPLFPTDKLDSFDYVLFPFQDVRGNVKFIGDCSSQRICGFHMVLAKRDVAIAALEYACMGRFYREDAAYIIWLMENCVGAQAAPILVHKIGDHLPNEMPKLREIMKQECKEIWRKRLLKIRQDILPRLPLVEVI